MPSNMNLRAMRSGRCRNPATNKLCVVQTDEKNYASLPKILKIKPNSVVHDRMTLAIRIEELGRVRTTFAKIAWSARDAIKPS